MTGRFQEINYDIEKLPPMPVVAAQMIELINSPMTSTGQLAKVVEKDPAVSARVLKIANSSFYSMSRQVTTLNTAIVILGDRTLKNLVLAASMRGMHSAFGSIEKMLWEDSMVCALGTRFLASKTGLANPEEAFMAGLFRHIGKVVICNQEDNKDDFVTQLVKSESLELMEQEKTNFGVSHDEIGAAVLEKWQLSESFSEVALHHLDVNLDGVKDDATKNMICLVNIANKFPHLFGVFGQAEEVNLAELPGALKLSLGEEWLAEVIEDFKNIFEENREEFLS